MQEKRDSVREDLSSQGHGSINGNPKVKVIVVFRNDDPSACSDVNHERRCADMFDRYGLRQTLGVIPLDCKGGYHRHKDILHFVKLDENPRMVEFLREYVARSGSEIALHGYTHKTNRLSRPWRREWFEFEGLDLDEQEAMIARATQILVETLGTRPCTFIAPWNRMDSNTVLACSRQGYKIVSSGPFVPVVDGVVSLGMNCELDTFPSMFEKAQAAFSDTLLVINYHSRYIREVRDFELLEGALNLCAHSANTEVLTLAEVVRLYPELVRKSNEAAMNIVSQWQLAATNRARAILYRRALLGLGIRNRLERTYSTACSLYWQGRYEEVCGLSPLIDRLCNRLQAFGRCAVCVIGAVVGILTWAISSRFFQPDKTQLYLAVLLTIALSGAALHWRLTNKDTKREALIVILLSIVAVLFGMALGELLGFTF